MPKTKIICTIGPSSNSPEIIGTLIESGMNVARLNFSHGTHEQHRQMIEIIREVSDRLEQPVAILQDLCGPKIRVAKAPEKGIELKPGQIFTLCSEEVTADNSQIGVSYENLPTEVKSGDRILLADGMMELTVKETNEKTITCEVITGGILTSHKGINLPTGTIKAPALTKKDKEDLVFGLKHDVDYVALSFVTTANDIEQIKKIISDENKDTPVIAKIEKHEALNHVDEIMTISDGIMVARGDLGVEIPLEQVPGIQKMLVQRANEYGKPVIIATQMLRSMVESPRPTRAEATDVANGVIDGADAIMLSEETASGQYPVEAVKFMAKIAKNAESHFPHDRHMRLSSKKHVAESVSYASCVMAEQLEAAAIVATTRSGFTAMQISRYRPRPNLIALSPDKKTIRRLALYWGCIPNYVPETRNTDDRIEKAAVSAIGTGSVSKGDLVVITTGHPVWAAGTTNMIRVKKL